eukprot:3605949-Amphidinium_carterae.4
MWDTVSHRDPKDVSSGIRKGAGLTCRSAWRTFQSFDGQVRPGMELPLSYRSGASCPATLSLDSQVPYLGGASNPLEKLTRGLGGESSAAFLT